MRDKQFEEWLRERDEAIASLDIETFKEFYSKWVKCGVYKMPLPSDNVLEISIRKSALAATHISPDIKRKAAEWLIERGYSTEI